MSDAPLPTDRRAADRVACDVPFRLLHPPSWPALTVRDVSATGVRLRVDLAGLGLRAPVGMGALARSLKGLIHADLRGEFDPHRLGSLVGRRLRLVRIVRYGPGDGAVELGCALDPPLGREEAAALGLALPLGLVSGRSPVFGDGGFEDAGETILDGYERAFRGGLDAEEDGASPAPALSFLDDADRQVRSGAQFTALLTSREYRAAPPLLGPLTSMSPSGVVLLVEDVRRLVPASEVGDVASVALGFHAAYGAETELQISESGVPRWLGAVRMDSVESLPGPDGRVLLGLRFGQVLGPEAWSHLRSAS
jgi:hypothetical protein